MKAENFKIVVRDCLESKTKKKLLTTPDFLLEHSRKKEYTLQYDTRLEFQKLFSLNSQSWNHVFINIFFCR